MFFDILKSIYTKKQIEIVPDTNLLITLNKWLSYDKDNVLPLKKILSFFYYLTPQHYFDLLFFNIPQKQTVPFLKKIIEIEKPEKDILLERIKYIFDWSNRELEFNRNILLKQIETNRKFWETELGIK